MGIIRTCKSCGQKNRTGAGHLADTGRCGACKADLGPVDEPIAVTTAEFDEIVQGAKVPVLVDFWAAWCGPCRAIAPVMEQLAAESGGRYVVAKLNTDQNPRTAAQFHIDAIPTMLLFKDGQLVDQIVGLQPKQAIAAKLAKVA